MKELEKLQHFFQTLGDENRLQIINIIGMQERSVSEIVQATGLSQPLVSHHLKTLRNSQILDSRRKGPFVLYSLKEKKLLDALGMISEVMTDFKNEEKSNSMFGCPPWWRQHWKK